MATNTPLSQASKVAAAKAAAKSASLGVHAHKVVDFSFISRWWSLWWMPVNPFSGITHRLSASHGRFISTGIVAIVIGIIVGQTIRPWRMNLWFKRVINIFSGAGAGWLWWSVTNQITNRTDPLLLGFDNTGKISGIFLASLVRVLFGLAAFGVAYKVWRSISGKGLIGLIQRILASLGVFAGSAMLIFLATSYIFITIFRVSMKT